MDSPNEILGQHGPFAQQVAGFAPRVEQQAMADAVQAALEQGEHLIVEAGTGTGKTFAYLVPALLSGRKVVVSTGTRNLQDQLFHRDLPVVRKALQVPASVALLKGRSNYLCLHRLQLAEETAYQYPAEMKKLQRIRDWAGRTRRGDIAELPEVDEQDMIWPKVTSTADNCLGQECEYFDRCHLVEARREAQAADVVVINHHLLFADMALREAGFGELLPSVEAFIVDEAHQLPEVASGFFGTALSANQLLELARDSRDEYINELNEDRELVRLADELEKAVRDMRLLFRQPGQRGNWKTLADQPDMQAVTAQLGQKLARLQAALEPCAPRSKALDKCYQRARELGARFEELVAVHDSDDIHWYEVHPRSFTLHLTPLDIAGNFREQLESSSASWVFTSATLAVADRFDHFQQRLGLEQAATARWDSPFDFARQTLLYLPEQMPAPNAPDYTEAVVAQARRVLKISGGRAFLLFTSHRALQEAAGLLRDQVPWPLFVQGEAPRDVLLEQFRRAGNGVLLGTSSFWEGVDVRGEALSCVIIDKLPFASPGDPVLQARIEALQKQGVNAFMAYQLPAAVITLKQGAGRLIRDVNDYGLLMICDPRLHNKPYGRVFLQSLPPMPRTRDLAEVRGFFTQHEQAETAPV
ncbi:ATP-dependent DNA helicase [Thiohalophilus sp.]|uniref:ATP-dependent DNA helicase n=1 Tax=Thiohalophilus sp. TaxID=3028392 RepID=UPI002ACE13A9|nr:ATP-dependent DNA helicase [Thiohalophilus sp.]MDZ7663202.1 ATP-dependent DNA helicase [Thiohalophilus sp.]